MTAVLTGVKGWKRPKRFAADKLFLRAIHNFGRAAAHAKRADAYARSGAVSAVTTLCGQALSHFESGVLLVGIAGSKSSKKFNSAGSAQGRAFTALMKFCLK